MPKVQGPSGHEGGLRRRGRGRRVSSVLSEINVVPLVDVMLVLLIIFMVAAPMMQRGLEVNLPEARHADQISSERVFVTIPLSFRTDQMLQVDEESIRFQVLSALMQQEMEGRSDRQVFVRGDGGVTFQELVSVMDALKDGGVENVGLITDPLPER